MTNLKKFILTFIAFFITLILSFFIVLAVSSLPSGQYSDYGFIEVGIIINIAILIACTTLIILTIKQNQNNKS